MTDGTFHKSSIRDSMMDKRQAEIEPMENKIFASLADVHWISFFFFSLSSSLDHLSIDFAQ